MSREIEQDFEKVMQFYNNYSMSDITVQEGIEKQLKCMHRKLYSYMIFLGEQANAGTFDETTLAYQKEVVSDMIMAFFCWSNGIYKSAKLLLRSGIENFVKAIVYTYCPEIIQNKNVYEVFELAKKQSPFSDAYTAIHFDNIHAKYADLCATVHGSMDKLASIGGLIQFPCYDITEANHTYDDYVKIIDEYLSCVYYVYYEQVYKMHEFNRDLFLQGVQRREKQKIYELKSEECSI